MNSEPLYCELCGSPIRGKAYKIKLEGATLIVCEKCYKKITAKPGSVEVLMEKKKKTKGKPKFTRKTRRPRHVEYEVVDDYFERIKKARIKMGWNLSVLAQRVMEKETVLKRIEQGRLRPSIELSKRLERVLGITLLEPVVEEEYEPTVSLTGEYELTLGDLANVKIKGKKKP